MRWILPIATVSARGSAWRFTTERPPTGWTEPDFRDDAWGVGEAGFGTEVPGSRPRTPWTTPDIWLRRKLDLPEGAGPDLKLLIHHDEDVEVYVNGTQVYGARGHVVARAHGMKHNQTGTARVYGLIDGQVALFGRQDDGPVRFRGHTGQG